MLKNITLGRYYPGTSVLHRLDPRIKMVLSLSFMVVIFLTSKPLPLLLVTALTLVLVALSRVPVSYIAGSLKPILFILLFAFVLNLFTVPGDPLFVFGPLTISNQGLYTAVRMAARLIFLVINTTLLLTLTTTPLLISDALEQLLNPLKRLRFPVHELAMMMSIALRFVPTLLEETDKIMKAQSSRGADYDTGNLVAKARGLVTVLIPLFVSAFKRAEELAIAMEARCYRGGEGRTRLHVLKLDGKDKGFAAGFFLVTVVIILAQFL